MGCDDIADGDRAYIEGLVAVGQRKGDELDERKVAEVARVIRDFHWFNYGLDEVGDIPEEQAEYATELARKIVEVVAWNWNPS